MSPASWEGIPSREVTLLWDALCTGLAIRELCGPIQPSEGEQVWTDALTALLRGLRSAAPAHGSD